MGGDHKCPVCQATFTRPQHVARHMRSHTGDRPYKCQYCGDQFARSDLLSRHVNKCHANEKPAGASATGRRKGSTSLSRATTSKQACDQCVQSSLPCDGSNPCSKCVQRKYRCTYVKFHRQTAPVGPGHNPNPTLPSTRSQEHHTGPSSAVLGLSNVPSLNISLSGSSTSGHGGVRFPSLYSTASPVDDFYHLPPPTGYTTTSSSANLGSGHHAHTHGHGHTTNTADPVSLYGSAYTMSAPRIPSVLDDDLYGSMNRPGTASSAGSSSASGHGWHAPPPPPPPGAVGAASSADSTAGWSSQSQSQGGAPHTIEPRAFAQHQPHSLDPRHAQNQWAASAAASTGRGDLGPGGHVGGGGGGGGGGGYQPSHDLDDPVNQHAQTFRELFAEDFGTQSPLLRAGGVGGGGGGGGGDGGVSDGGSSDGAHSVQSGRSAEGFGQRRRRIMNDLSTRSDPYAFEYGQRRARAGSTASTSSTRPSTRHGYDSIAPSPLITGQNLAPGGHQSLPASATNTHFSNAFGSMSLEDANALASLVASANGGGADGRSLVVVPQGDPDATPMGLPNAVTGAGGNSLGYSPIQRPVSSLAALPPSGYLNSVWNQAGYGGGGVDDSMLLNWNSMLGGSGTGWTPGGLLPDFSFSGMDANTGAGASSSSSSSSSAMGLGLSGGGTTTGMTPTPGREMDAKEMKEFWKMYMRTPLTGPGTSDGNGGSGSGSGSQSQVGGGGDRNPNAGHSAGDNGGDGTSNSNSSSSGNSNSTMNVNGPLPTPGFRRPRVASLPSSHSTPKLHRDGAVAHLHHLQQQQRSGKPGGSVFGPMSSLRTTLQGPLGGPASGNSKKQEQQLDGVGLQEDLSSYGAAVLARKAPMNLSLAGALGRMKRQQTQNYGQALALVPGLLAQGELSSSGPSSRGSSVGLDGGVSEGVGDVKMGGADANEDRVVKLRPSVKRLASSVLENDVVKIGRFDETGGGDDDDSTPQAEDSTTSATSTTTRLAAPKPSAPFGLPPVSNPSGDGHESLGGEGMKKSASAVPMFPPAGPLVGAGAVGMPPPSSSAPPRGAPQVGGHVRSGSGMNLLERRGMSMTGATELQ